MTKPNKHNNGSLIKHLFVIRYRWQSVLSVTRITHSVQSQRAATRLLSGFKELSDEQRHTFNGLTTLEVRRQRGDLIECYKISTGKNIDPHQFFHLSDNSHGLRWHSLKLSFNRSRLYLEKNVFSQTVISSRNSFAQHVVDATSVNNFKTASMLTGRPPDMDNKGPAAYWSP